MSGGAGNSNERRGRKQHKKRGERCCAGKSRGYQKAKPGYRTGKPGSGPELGGEGRGT